MTTTATSHPDASVAYTLAYDNHYKKGELLYALDQYQELVTRFPNTPEATNARAQIDNIAKSVIPRDQLMTLKLDLARTILFRSM